MKSSSPPPEPISVREVPIELCQFLKFSGLTQTGGEAKQLIADGRVRVNGLVELRKRKQLNEGDQVTFAGRVVTVRLASP
jgi:ribosome-associated protein